MEKDGRKDLLLRYYTWNEHSTALVEYLLFETFSTWQKNMQVTLFIFLLHLRNLRTLFHRLIR